VLITFVQIGLTQLLPNLGLASDGALTEAELSTIHNMAQTWARRRCSRTCLAATV